MVLNSTSVFNTNKPKVFCRNLLLRFRIRNSVHEKAWNSAEFRWNSVELNSGKFRGIPYSAEFQKITSVHTL
jgi:hypothetical protein